MRGAGRLAGWLAARGLTATARGRLAWVELPADPAEAATAARRAACAPDVPVVLALDGPRRAALEHLVDEQDLVVVAADPGSALARMALSGLGDRGVSAIATSPLSHGAARLLALAGVTAPRLPHDLATALHGLAARGRP
jgi:hypothetical protein